MAVEVSSLTVPLRDESNRRRSAAAPWLSLAGGILLISLSVPIVKAVGQAGVAGSVSAFYRLFFAALALAPATLRQARSAPRPSLPALRLAALCGLLFAADLAFWNTSLLLVPAAEASLLANSTPLWVALLAWLTATAVLRPPFWLGLAMSLLGSAVLVWRGPFAASMPLGSVFAIVASLFYAAYVHTAKQARAALPTVLFLGVMTSTAALALAPVCLLLRLPMFAFAPSTWLALLALGWVSHVGGWLLTSFALGRLPAPLVSLVLLVQAPLSVLLCFWWFGEPVTARQVAGGLLVLAGVLVASR